MTDEREHPVAAVIIYSLTVAAFGVVGWLAFEFVRWVVGMVL
jgi:hypothetical protein